MELDYSGLISLSLSEHTKKVLQNDSEEKLTFYIDNSQGWEYLDTYYYSDGAYKISKNNIRISKLGHSQNEIAFIRETFQKLDALIDLDFEELSHNNGSQIDIYSIEFSSNMPTNSLGQALPQSSAVGSWWDIFWKDTSNNDIKLNQNDKNTLVHEIGHALGLSHPFEDPFNQQWDTDNTVMSYNKGAEDWGVWFSLEDEKALQKIWGRENDNGELTFSDQSYKYTFKRTKDNQYFIESEIGDESISSINKLNFKDKSLNVENDIKGVFKQLKGVDHITGKVFRLYNAAFNRFPDLDGIKYWINKNETKENDLNQTSKSFLGSKEFINKYGSTITNEKFLNNLYNNILDREADLNGFNYWVGQLNNNREERYEVLLGFSESTENKKIFMHESGLLN